MISPFSSSNYPLVWRLWTSPDHWSLLYILVKCCPQIIQLFMISSLWILEMRKTNMDIAIVRRRWKEEGSERGKALPLDANRSSKTIDVVRKKTLSIAELAVVALLFLPTKDSCWLQFAYFLFLLPLIPQKVQFTSQSSTQAMLRSSLSSVELNQP